MVRGIEVHNVSSIDSPESHWVKWMVQVEHPFHSRQSVSIVGSVARHQARSFATSQAAAFFRVYFPQGEEDAKGRACRSCSGISTHVGANHLPHAGGRRQEAVGGYAFGSAGEGRWGTSACSPCHLYCSHKAAYQLRSSLHIL